MPEAYQNFLQTFSTPVVALIIALFIQAGAWVLQAKNNNADYVDIAWSLCVAIIAALYLVDAGHINLTSIVLLVAPLLWYLRLSWHLIARFNVKHEDGRYQYLRKHWQLSGSNASVQFKFFLFFIFQAFLAWFFSFQVYLILEQAQTVLWLDGLALLLIVISFVGVTLSDAQLLKFKKAGKGGVCDQGFWRYSRHPNYFFEWLHWCAYPLLGFYLGALSDPYWWLLLSYPLWMFLFLWKITGIPFNEEQNIRSKGDAYRRYQKTTNAFFPGKPKGSK